MPVEKHNGRWVYHCPLGDGYYDFEYAGVGGVDEAITMFKEGYICSSATVDLGGLRKQFEEDLRCFINDYYAKAESGHVVRCVALYPEKLAGDNEFLDDTLVSVYWTTCLWVEDEVYFVPICKEEDVAKAKAAGHQWDEDATHLHTKVPFLESLGIYPIKSSCKWHLWPPDEMVFGGMVVPEVLPGPRYASRVKSVFELFGVKSIKDFEAALKKRLDCVISPECLEEMEGALKEHSGDLPGMKEEPRRFDDEKWLSEIASAIKSGA